MAKYTFVVNTTISMHCDVYADSLDEAIEEAQAAGVMSLCHQCARSHAGEWSTSGELDGDPATGELVEVLVDGEINEQDLHCAAPGWKGEG